MGTGTGTDMILSTSISDLPGLLQFCSQTLPVGAYAYSHGVESTIHQMYMVDAQSASESITGVFNHGISELDLPALFLAYDACERYDLVIMYGLNKYFAASRKTHELLLEDVGPVGSGKTALVRSLCMAMKGRFDIVAITNDIDTQENAEFMLKHEALTVDPGVMDRDSKSKRGDRPFLFTNLKSLDDLSEAVDFVVAEVMLAA